MAQPEQMIQIQAPDGSIAEFPVGTPDSVIEQVMAAEYGAPVGYGEDMAKGYGTGFVQGAIGLASLPQGLGNWLGEKAGYGLNRLMGDTPEQAQAGMDQVQATRKQAGFVPPSSQDMTQGFESTFGPMYEAQTMPGQVAQTLGQFTPGMFIGPGTAAQRVVSGTSAALGSEAAGQASDGKWYEPYMRLGGALLGGIAPDVARRALTPMPISPERQKQVALLGDEGVDLTAGQKTGRKPLQYLESELGGGKAAGVMERQGEQFTRAAAAKAGIKADRLTPDVMDDAFRVVGDKFDDLASRTPLPVDARMQDDMLEAVMEYQSLTGAPASAAEDIMNRVSELATKNNGVLDGAAYKTISTELRKKASKASSPELREALHGIKDALDSAIERGLSGDLLKEWKAARTQYRNMLVLEKTMMGAGEKTAEGIVSPSQLRNATVQKQGGRNYVRGKGDFAPLARAGEATMKPLPNSGTAGRFNAQNMGTGITTLLGAGIGGAGAGGAGAMVGGLLGMGVPFAAGRALMSKPVQAYLANQMLSGRGLPAAQKAIVPLLGVTPQIGGPR